MARIHHSNRPKPNIRSNRPVFQPARAQRHLTSKKTQPKIQRLQRKQEHVPPHQHKRRLQRHLLSNHDV